MNDNTEFRSFMYKIYKVIKCKKEVFGEVVSEHTLYFQVWGAELKWTCVIGNKMNECLLAISNHSWDSTSLPTLWQLPIKVISVP